MEYGAARPGGTRPEFDAAFVALRDPDLRGLSDDPRVRLWLKERNSVAACGEDCE
jgi:hypothetical protein